MNKTGVGVYVSAFLLLIGVVAGVIFQPLYTVAALAGGVFLWSFMWKVEKFFLFHTAIIFVFAVGIPALRLGSDFGQLKLVVPAVLVMSATALLARVRVLPPAGLVWALAAAFLLHTLATGAVRDPYEWETLALTVTVVYAGLVVAGSVTKLGLWKQLAGLVIGMAAAQAALGLLEMMFLAEPLWRGGRILPDGRSVALRNELIPSMTRAQGTLAHPLPYAFTLILGCALLMRSEGGRSAGKVLLWAMLAAGIIASGSRNAIALFVIVTLLGLIKPRAVGRFGFATFVAVVGGIVALPFILEQIERLTGSGSVFHRMGALDSIERLIFARGIWPSMFGDGSAATPRLFSTGLLQTDGFEAVDNQYVLTLAQEGIIGLVILILILAVAFKRADATLKLILFAIMAECMIFDLLSWPSMAIYAWVFIGVAIGRKPAPRDIRGGRPTPHEEQLQRALERNARLEAQSF